MFTPQIGIQSNINSLITVSSTEIWTLLQIIIAFGAFRYSDDHVFHYLHDCMCRWYRWLLHILLQLPAFWLFYLNRHWHTQELHKRKRGDRIWGFNLRSVPLSIFQIFPFFRCKKPKLNSVVRIPLGRWILEKNFTNRRLFTMAGFSQYKIF